MTDTNKIDAIVAERVMGFVVQWFDRHYSGDGDWSQQPAESKAECKHYPVAYWKNQAGQSVHEVSDFSPSTDMNHAMEIVEKYRAAGSVVTMEGFPSAWRVNIGAPSPDGGIPEWNWKNNVEHNSLPLAICLAALRAVGVEVPDAM